MIEKMAPPTPKDAGSLVVSEKMKRGYVWTAYVVRYHEPAVEDWPKIITELSADLGCAICEVDL